MGAFQSVLTGELLKINDMHCVHLKHLEAVCNSLKRDLNASLASSHKMFDDALAWKNKWLKGEELCAQYRHELTNCQAAIKRLVDDRAKLQSELSALRCASPAEDSKTLPQEELQKAFMANAQAAYCMFL